MPPAARPARSSSSAAFGHAPVLCADGATRPPSLATLLENSRLLADRRVSFSRDARIARQGHALDSLVLVLAGSCKSSMTSPDGHDHVVGYHIAGDVLGAAGLGAGVHDASIVALEACECALVPVLRLMAASQADPALHHALFAYLSGEIARNRTRMLVLGGMRADQRVAAFLLDVADRRRARGSSSTEFEMRMTRAEIAQYLGLAVETVSRLFARLHREAIIRVTGRSVKLLAAEDLRRLVDADIGDGGRNGSVAASSVGRVQTT